LFFKNKNFSMGANKSRLREESESTYVHARPNSTSTPYYSQNAFLRKRANEQKHNFNDDDDVQFVGVKRARQHTYMSGASTSAAHTPSDDHAASSPAELLAAELASPRAPNVRDWMKYIVKTGNFRAPFDRSAFLPSVLQSIQRPERAQFAPPNGCKQPPLVDLTSAQNDALMAGRQVSVR
jgi:hypothetical protein